MKNKVFKYYQMATYSKVVVLMCAFLLLGTGCEREYSDQVDFATFPNNGNVFIDGFSGGLQYFPFDGSKLDAFSVDNGEKYKGDASMRFDVPNFGDPSGSFAGAVFPDNFGRDLRGFDALTFWAKATRAATVNEIGFGIDFEANKYPAIKTNLVLDTGWKKYTIPIPDPSKLVREKGMFIYAAGPENGEGFSFWIDELQFEKLGTIAQPQPAIFNGEDRVVNSFLDLQIPVTGLTQTFNLASGTNETVNAAPAYFNFSSTDPDVARVSESGIITMVGTGTATITATLGAVKARGSMTLEVQGAFDFAPVPPERNPEDVISIFSDAYANVPVDFYNGFFDGQTTTGGLVRIDEDNNIIVYENLNFVATSFTNPTVNVSQKTFFHVDIRIEESIDPGDTVRFELIDFGPDGAFGGGDDTGGAITYASGQLETGNWISLDIPLTDFSETTGGGLSGFVNGAKANVAQIVFASGGISTLLVDNMYFYSE